MQYPHYRLAQLASDYKAGKAHTKNEFVDFLEKEIFSILQKYVKRPKEDLITKVEESKKKILDEIIAGSYDTEDVKKWISTKITPIATSYAAELKRAMKEQKKSK